MDRKFVVEGKDYSFSDFKRVPGGQGRYGSCPSEVVSPVLKALS